MHIESVKLTNFRCFGSKSDPIQLDSKLTALVGANGTGKTAVCIALMRMFGVSQEQRTLRVEDFHVPAGESDPPATRALSVEVILSFPELDSFEGEGTAQEKDAAVGSFPVEGDADCRRNAEDTSMSDRSAHDAVPEFFHQMAATVDGKLKCRIVLEATWTDDGSLDGSIDDQRRVVYTFDEDYGDRWVPLRSGDRNRIQVVYVPASRDGARHLTTFLRSRLWRASTWSADLEGHVVESAEEMTRLFRAEPAVSAVEQALSIRWRELHQADTDSDPLLEPSNRTAKELAGRAELMFNPSHQGRHRPAAALSDGQRSLLQLALTAATLDLEAKIAVGKSTEFELTTAVLPRLTVLVVEEPENNLSPFFLSRVIHQMLDLAEGVRTQAILASHSAGALSRVSPDRVRHFRLDQACGEAIVTRINLPDDKTAAGKYIREAVRAYPELYFARLVILGEGDSEETVLPIIADACGVPIDRSFVAVVPLGGRHTNHFWRLLRQLQIPHLTLLDLDYGRNGGGAGRIRDACKRLLDVGIDPFDGIVGYDSIDDLKELDTAQISEWLSWLQRWDIYFCTPLDLDMTLLSAYFDEYSTLEDGADGPKESDDPTATVLGENYVSTEYWSTDEAKTLMRWYRYLFLTKSKPSTHLRVMSQLEDSKLSQPPDILSKLINRIKNELQLT